MGTPQLELVAVNDIIPIENIVYLLKYDTVYGRYEKTAESNGENVILDGKPFRYYNTTRKIQPGFPGVALE